MTIRAGVVGLGIVSNRIIQQFDKHPEIELTAVCDVNESRVREFIDSRPNVEGYADYQSLIASPSVDLVYVSTPPAYHADIVTLAMSSGKHVLCEKPLANSLEEANRMLEAARESGKVHAMHFPLQYSPEVLQFEQMYREGAIGELRRVEVVMQFPEWPRPWQKNAWVGERKQGGYTLEVGVHFIQTVQRIFGRIQNLTGRMTFPPNDDVLCETSVLATGQLIDVPGNVDILFDGFSQAGGKERVELNAYGTKGTLALHNWGILLHGKLGEELQRIEAKHAPSSLMDNLVRVVHGDDAVLCDFEIGYHAQEVLEALRDLGQR